jgi:hypothetical protein
VALRQTPLKWIKSCTCPFYKTLQMWNHFLVLYATSSLSKLANFTCILTPLTTKETRQNFPIWTMVHHNSFDTIKALGECLTTINHDNMDDNKLFVICDASNWHTGVALSFGPLWALTQPVTFDSMQLKGLEKIYPVHKKELLAIICTLKKWRSDLLGIPL